MAPPIMGQVATNSQTSQYGRSETRYKYSQRVQATYLGIVLTVKVPIEMRKTSLEHIYKQGESTKGFVATSGAAGAHSVGWTIDAWLLG